jgi:mRNA interferase RelE/StbE
LVLNLPPHHPQQAKFSKALNVSRVERFLDYMQVKATPRFIESLNKLDTAIKQRVLHKTTELADNPYDGKMLRSELRGLFSLRVGDYRIIYWVDDKENIVWLVNVGHRRRVYERV